MANPLQRLSTPQLQTMLDRAQDQLVKLGPATTTTWSDGGHSEGVKTITVLELLEILNDEMDRRDPAQHQSGVGKAVFGD